MCIYMNVYMYYQRRAHTWIQPISSPLFQPNKKELEYCRNKPRINQNNYKLKVTKFLEQIERSEGVWKILKSVKKVNIDIKRNNSMSEKGSNRFRILDYSNIDNNEYTLIR